MKIEINGPRPEKIKPREKLSPIKNLLKGLKTIGLLFTMGTIVAYPSEGEEETIIESQTTNDETSESLEENILPEEQKSEKLFQGSEEEIFQQALDFPKDFVEQQGLAAEYQNPKQRQELEKLIQNQVQEIFDTHHQNIKELDKLFEYVQIAAPIIFKEAQEQKVPFAIALGMAMHESRCNPSLHDSLSGAAGLFQIKKTTAESLGLQVSKKEDERLDPIKNTRAALIYLKKLYNQYGRWDLAMLAYNEGMGNLNHYLRSIQEKPGQPLLEKIDKQNLQKKEVTYLSLHQNFSEQNKYPLNVEANVRLYLWYVYEKASSEQDILAQK
ncbi:MAG: transglycosylase SLT domain-containing protein [Patescibacteria group bacterium]|jgi:hypothetical protein